MKYIETQAKENKIRSHYQALKRLYMGYKDQPRYPKWYERNVELLNKQTQTSIDIDMYHQAQQTCWELDEPPGLEEWVKTFKHLHNHKYQEKSILYQKYSGT